MRLGIIGLPQSGKTTIFNALTRGDQPTAISGGRFEVHTSVVDVPDSRVDRLVDLFHPRKITFAKVTYADIAGLEAKTSENKAVAKKDHAIAGQLLNQLSQMDGFVHVVRCFDNPSIPHYLGNVDPQRDVALMDAELILNDLITVERKLGRLTEEQHKDAGRDKNQVARERALFERLQQALLDDKPLRDVDLSSDDQWVLSGYGLLTRKPVLILLNLADGQDPVALDYPHNNSKVVSLQGKLEMELAQLPVDEAEAFMVEFGVKELGLSRVISVSYDLLQLQSFFTVGEDEVRAWTVRRGARAVDAAGVIHTDLQKGFIRAEVVAFAELIQFGSLVEARNRGRLRLEGKDYQVQDGEIMHVRFNV